MMNFLPCPLENLVFFLKILILYISEHIQMPIVSRQIVSGNINHVGIELITITQNKLIIKLLRCKIGRDFHTGSCIILKRRRVICRSHKAVRILPGIHKLIERILNA